MNSADEFQTDDRFFSGNGCVILCIIIMAFVKACHVRWPSNVAKDGSTLGAGESRLKFFESFKREMPWLFLAFALWQV